MASNGRREFAERLDELTLANEYLRFVPHPFDERFVLYVTINRTSDGAPLDRAQYISSSRSGAARVLVPALRLPAVRTALGRALRLARHRSSLNVRFSTSLFVQSGVVRRFAEIARVGQLALDRPDWLNMELAIPRDRFSQFDDLFAALRPPTGPLSPAQPYYTCRVVGAADNVLLGPNHDRDVLFMDVRAPRQHPASEALLRNLEEAAVTSMAARPHWGKVFYSGQETIRGLYPDRNIKEFVAAKTRFDPTGVFSNDYTRRVMGL